MGGFKVLCAVISLLAAFTNAEESKSYVQENGSLDGYYVDDAQSANGVDSTYESTTAEESTHETMHAGIMTTSEQDSNTEMTVTSELTAGTELSHTTTEWWTPESELTTTSKMDTITYTSPHTTPAMTYASAITSTTSLSATASVCNTVWGQCGGVGFEGATCCEPGLSCVSIDSYWAHCVLPTTVETLTASDGSIRLITETYSASSTTSGSSSPNDSTKKAATTIVATEYSLETFSSKYTIASTDSAGHKYVSTYFTESVKSVVMGVSSIVEYKNSTNAAVHVYGPTGADYLSFGGKWTLVVLVGAGLLAL